MELEMDLMIDDTNYENFDIIYEQTTEETTPVVLGFNCQPDSKQMNEKSFLVHKDADQFLNKSSISSGFYTCFGRELHKDMTSDVYILEAMFNKACISYNIIKSATSNNALLERKTTMKMERSNISNYLQQVIRNLNFQNDKTSNQIKCNVISLYNLIGPISSIECDIRYDSSYYMMHGHLDWKWLILTILLKLEIQSNRGNVILEGTKFEKYVKIILFDLLQFAIKRFNKVSVSELYDKSPFPCTCFKEFWKLLYTLLEGYNISFWNQLSVGIKLIDDGTNIYEVFDEPILNRKFKNLKIKIYDIFAVWIYSFVSNAIDVDESDSFNSTSNENYYEFLEKLTTKFLTNNPSEDELRVYLFNLKGIMMPWQSKIEIVTILWNYYHKQVNLPCSLPGSTISKNETDCDDFLKSIKKNCLMDVLNKTHTSFTMFANILFCLIDQLKLTKKQNQIDKILGRIYSRLPQSKLVLLPESGLINISVLLITVYLATKAQEVLHKICDIFMQYPMEKMNETRQSCIVKIQMMLVILLIRDNLSAEIYLEKLLTRVNDLFNSSISKNETRPNQILHTLFNGFLHLFQNHGPYIMGEHLLFGPWTIHFLKCASSTELDRLFELTNRILIQIHRYDDEDSKKLYNSIYKHLYPFVKTHFTNLQTSLHISTLASNLCACYRDRSKFELIINDFVEIDCRETEPFLHFWINLIKSDNVFYIKPSLIIKCWIQYWLLTPNEETNPDLREFSLFVFELDEFKEMCSNPLHGAEKFTMTKNTLHTFFHRIEITYTNMSLATDRSKLVDRFQYYFKDFEKWVPPQMIKTREFTIKLIKMISNLVLFCGAIAYQRQKPSNIFNTMMEKYIMPIYLLMGRKPPELSFIQSIHCVYPMLLFGLSKMDYMRDAQLKMYLSNLIEKWFPHFDKVSGKNDVLVKPFIHIINKCDGQMISFLCRKLAHHFITVKDSRQPHLQASLAITVIKEMFTAIKPKVGDEKLCILIESTLYDLMVHALRTNDVETSNKSILLFLVELSEFMKQDSCPNQIKEAYTDSIRNLIKTHLSHQTEASLKFFYRILKLNPTNGPDLLQMIKDEFSELQNIRKNDTYLQSLFTKFLKSLT